MSSLHACVAAIALLAACAAAHATATATVVGRESVTHVQHFGGFAIVGSTGEDGSDVPVTALTPVALGVSGTHHHEGSYLYWDVQYTHQWTLSQAWGADPAARAFGAWGSTQLATDGTVVGLNCNPCLPTLQIDAYNSQALDFTLDSATRYGFRSETTQGQWIDLLVWNTLANDWHPIWIGAGINQGIAWESSGTLQAGLYRVRNNRDNARVGTNNMVHASAWDWTMELPEATVSAVPEPGAAWMLAAGLLLIGVRRLRP